jgi:hypothetical protein
MGEADRRVRAAAILGIQKFAVHKIGQAAELAPVGGPPVTPRDPDPGHLQASATWLPPVISGNQITQTIGFNADYAAVQHEVIDFRHNVGQAKYLEAVMNHDEPSLETTVGNEVKKVL